MVGIQMQLSYFLVTMTAKFPQKQPDLLSQVSNNTAEDEGIVINFLFILYSKGISFWLLYVAFEDSH